MVFYEELNVYYATQWDFIIFNNESHMTVTPPKKMTVVADTLRQSVIFFYEKERENYSNLQCICKIDYFLP